MQIRPHKNLIWKEQKAKGEDPNLGENWGRRFVQRDKKVAYTDVIITKGKRISRITEYWYLMAAYKSIRKVYYPNVKKG